MDDLWLSVVIAVGSSDRSSYLGLRLWAAGATLSLLSVEPRDWTPLLSLGTAQGSWQAGIGIGPGETVGAPDYLVLRWRELLEKGAGWDLI